MKIVNIVCSGTFNQEINFNSLLSLDPAIFQYDPEMYSGAYLLVNSKKVTLYKSGKYIFVGLTDFSDIDLQFNRMKKILKPYLIVDRITPPNIQNIVLVDQLPQKINLTLLIQTNRKHNIEYEPENFPGLIFRSQNGTALIFSSGKLVIVGVKSLEAADIVLKAVLSLIP